MMRTFDSVRPVARTGLIVGAPTSATGPPSPPDRSIVRPPNGLSFPPPFVACLSSVIASTLACSRYSGGVSEVMELGDHVAADRLEIRRIVDVLEVEDHVLRTGIGELAEAVDDARRRLRRDVDALECRALDLVGVAADRGAVLAQHLVFVVDRRRAAEDVARVAVLGHEAERFPLPAAADHDGWPRPRD